eukprot:9689394-Alexandrium_andersonii.AAC.1
MTPAWYGQTGVRTSTWRTRCVRTRRARQHRPQAPLRAAPWCVGRLPGHRRGRARQGRRQARAGLRA